MSALENRIAESIEALKPQAIKFQTQSRTGKIFYPNEFKQSVVELLHLGATTKKISDELGCRRTALYFWKRRFLRSGVPQVRKAGQVREIQINQESIQNSVALVHLSCQIKIEIPVDALSRDLLQLLVSLRSS